MSRMPSAAEISASELVPNPWRWQPAAVAWAQCHFSSAASTHPGERGNHGYLHAATGTGKTRVCFQISETVGGSDPERITRITMVGQTGIADQHHGKALSEEDEVKGYLALGCVETDQAGVLRTPMGHLHLVTTWQGLAARIKSEALRESVRDVEVIVFDECHMGGSNDDNTTWRKIRKGCNPRHSLFVSATTQPVSENLLGAMKNHVYFYHTDEAYADGILHDVDLVQMDVGLHAEVLRIRDKLGAATFDSAQETETIQVSVTPDQGLPEQARQLRDLGVANPCKSDDEEVTLLGLQKLQGQAMINHYLEEHRGEQAIFYSLTCAIAKHLSAYFAARTNGSVTHCTIFGDDLDKREKVAAFRASATKVVFAVDMLREGFDHPPLHVAYDLKFASKFDPRSIAPIIQRIGRLVRKSHDKPRGRYYFSRTVVDYCKRAAGLPELHDSIAQWHQEMGVYNASIREASHIAQNSLLGEDTMLEIEQSGEYREVCVKGTPDDLFPGDPTGAFAEEMTRQFGTEGQKIRLLSQGYGKLTWVSGDAHVRHAVSNRALHTSDLDQRRWDDIETAARDGWPKQKSPLRQRLWSMWQDHVWKQRMKDAGVYPAGGRGNLERITDEVIQLGWASKLRSDRRRYLTVWNDPVFGKQLRQAGLAEPPIKLLGPREKVTREVREQRICARWATTGKIGADESKEYSFQLKMLKSGRFDAVASKYGIRILTPAECAAASRGSRVANRPPSEKEVARALRVQASKEARFAAAYAKLSLERVWPIAKVDGTYYQTLWKMRKHPVWGKALIKLDIPKPVVGLRRTERLT